MYFYVYKIDVSIFNIIDNIATMHTPLWQCSERIVDDTKKTDIYKRNAFIFSGPSCSASSDCISGEGCSSDNVCCKFSYSIYL